jgi:hypothetical protein
MSGESTRPASSFPAAFPWRPAQRRRLTRTPMPARSWRSRQGTVLDW